MSLKKKDWLPYRRKAKFVEINVKDHHNQSIDFYKLEKGMTRDAKRIIRTLRNKYDFEMNPDESLLNEKNKFLKKDIEW